MKWLLLGGLTGAALWWLKKLHQAHVDDLKCEGRTYAWREIWHQESKRRAGIHEDAA